MVSKKYRILFFIFFFNVVMTSGALALLEGSMIRPKFRVWTYERLREKFSYIRYESQTRNLSFFELFVIFFFTKYYYHIIIIIVVIIAEKNKTYLGFVRKIFVVRVARIQRSFVHVFVFEKVKTVQTANL